VIGSSDYKHNDVWPMGMLSAIGHHSDQSMTSTYPSADNALSAG
jgi:hypothetical protein